jgi:hypothetical protein
LRKWREIALDILLYKIIEQRRVYDHLKKPAARMVIVGVNLQMLRELVDALGQMAIWTRGTGIGSWTRFP